MLTQRDLDIAELEAKAKIDKLFQEWMISYLGERANNGSNPGSGRGRGVTAGGQADSQLNQPNAAGGQTPDTGGPNVPAGY